MITFSEPDLTTSFMFRGVCAELPDKGSAGDVLVCRGKEYVWHDAWVMLGLTSELNASEINSGEMTAKICTRCGAPLKGHKCEYCGTEYR